MVEQAMDLAEQHGRRGYDAVQLAGALAVQTELTTSDVGQCVFVSAEANVHQAAQAEGLNDHPRLLVRSPSIGGDPGRARRGAGRAQQSDSCDQQGHEYG